MNNKIIKILVVLTFIAMVFVNILAISLPLNGVTTGQASDTYQNLFTPAGLTFSIWGLIYVLLAMYTYYQCRYANKSDNNNRDVLIRKINILFIITSFANILWIFAWHYGFIGLSLILMVVLLIFLIMISSALNKEDLSAKEKLFILLPFSVYFGWITVATIANVTVFLVSIGWNGYGIPDYIWTVIILIVGAIIGNARMLKDRSVAYGLVFVWAYFGIMIKHISAQGYSSQYTSIIYTLIICIIVFIGVSVFILKKSLSKVKY